AGVVHDEVGHAPFLANRIEQGLHLVPLARVAGDRDRPGFLQQRRELFGIARRERDLHAFLCEQPRERCAQAAAGADDQCGLRHLDLPEILQCTTKLSMLTEPMSMPSTGTDAVSPSRCAPMM